MKRTNSDIYYPFVTIIYNTYNAIPHSEVDSDKLYEKHKGALRTVITDKDHHKTLKEFILQKIIPLYQDTNPGIELRQVKDKTGDAGSATYIAVYLDTQICMRYFADDLVVKVSFQPKIWIPLIEKDDDHEEKLNMQLEEFKKRSVQ